MDAMEVAVGRLGDAVVYLANCWPGTMPGRKSPVAKQVEKILTPATQSPS